MRSLFSSIISTARFLTLPLAANTFAAAFWGGLETPPGPGASPMAALAGSSHHPEPASTDRWGDVNRDGNVNSADALITLHHVTGMPVGGGDMGLADVNGDGAVTSSDALVIMYFSVGLNTGSSRVGAPVTPPPPSQGTSRPAELPRLYLDTRYLPPTGRSIPVAPGGDLQKAINDAQPGDVILLQAGATFSGNFTLPKKSGTGWITIRTSAQDLPPEGGRIGPVHASRLAKIMSPNGSPAIQTAPGAAVSHYRLMGLEVTFATSGWNSGLVVFGDGTSGQSSLSQVPHDLVLDRSYVHGHPGRPITRCVVLNSARTAIIDSYLSECHDPGESNAIKGWNGPGPFKIVNNYLAGAGVNVMFGGVDPAIANLVPSDIEIRRNHFHKPTSWRGVWPVKNLFTLKNADRVLVEGNVFENNWIDDQDGYAILLYSANQDGGCPWCVTQNVTFRYNRVVNSPGAINTAHRATNGSYAAISMNRVSIYGNLLDRLNVPGFTGHGIAIRSAGDIADLAIVHNTFVSQAATHAILFTNIPAQVRFTFSDNVLWRGQNGVLGINGSEGSPTLDVHAPGATFAANIIIGASAGLYPTGNFFPSGTSAVGFSDPAAGNWRLSSGSPYKSAARDGSDPGADLDRVLAATQGAVLP
jgi:hypothetical protein